MCDINVRRASIAAFWLVLAVMGSVVASQSEAIPTPDWAVPKKGEYAPTEPKGKTTLPGSELALTQEQIDDSYNAPDWFPDEHEPMPPIVKHGNEPDVWACAMCHLASGNGHPQSAKLAGNSAEYLMRQLEAFKTGDRTSFLGDFIDNLHAIADDEDARSAAEWFASLPARPHQKVVETDTVPATTFDPAFMRTVRKDADGNVEQVPIAGRIIEVPRDYAEVKARNPHATFMTYVPPGSLDAGKKIAEAGVRGVAPCTSCHGTDLKGTGLGPALAGAFPTYVVRQLYDFRHGKRQGIADKTGYMSTMTKMLTPEEIRQVAAYIGSLPP